MGMSHQGKLDAISGRKGKGCFPGRNSGPLQDPAWCLVNSKHLIKLFLLLFSSHLFPPQAIYNPIFSDRAQYAECHSHSLLNCLPTKENPNLVSLLLHFPALFVIQSSPVSPIFLVPILCPVFSLFYCLQFVSRWAGSSFLADLDFPYARCRLS